MPHFNHATVGVWPGWVTLLSSLALGSRINKIKQTIMLSWRGALSGLGPLNVDTFIINSSLKKKTLSFLCFFR
jgi:hypothetical protein